MGPLGVLGGDHVGVGVEEEGGESGVGAGPFEEDEGLPWDELEGLGVEREGLGLGEDEIGCFAVLGVGEGGVDPEVLLEP